VAQIDPDPNYDHRIAEWATTYLQTRDPNLFPFTRNFTPEQHQAFVRDLREGLADLQDSGSARKTSAVGFIMSDNLLIRIVKEWAAANGGWPASHDPSNPEGRVSLRR
jgi:hypothetical protein